MTEEDVWILTNPGARPPYPDMAYFLWGDVDFDSDGNSFAGPNDPNWTELTIIRRPDHEERVEIDPISDSPLILKIRSSTPNLAHKAAEFLQRVCGGTLTQG